MKLLNRDADYAVRALFYAGRDADAVITAKEIVDELHMPYAFLRGIIQKLQKAGIVQTLKGKGGGFVLKKPLTKITLGEVVRAFLADPSMLHCSYKKKPCPKQRTCTLRRRLLGVEANLNKELDSITIASLL